MPTNQFISGRQSIVGWYSGWSIDSQDTLTFSALSVYRSINEIFPLDNPAEAYEVMMNGKARFRLSLQQGVYIDNCQVIDYAFNDKTSLF